MLHYSKTISLSISWRIIVFYFLFCSVYGFSSFYLMIWSWLFNYFFLLCVCVFYFSFNTVQDILHTHTLIPIYTKLGCTYQLWKYTSYFTNHDIFLILTSFLSTDGEFYSKMKYLVGKLGGTGSDNFQMTCGSKSLQTVRLFNAWVLMSELQQCLTH